MILNSLDFIECEFKVSDPQKCNGLSCGYSLSCLGTVNALQLI